MPSLPRHNGTIVQLMLFLLPKNQWILLLTLLKIVPQMIWSFSLQWLGPFGGTATKPYLMTRALLQYRFGWWQIEFWASSKLLAPSLCFLHPLPHRLGKPLPWVSSRLMSMALLLMMVGLLALVWWFVIVGASSLQLRTKFFQRLSLPRSLNHWRCKKGCCLL